MSSYHLFSVLDFEDDTLSVQKLYSGTLEDCEHTASRIHAVMYNGDKRVRQSLLRIISEGEYNEQFPHAGRQ
jgi:hypothetical protein